MFARLFFGLIAALLGGLMLWLVWGGAPEVAKRGAFTPTDPPWAFLMFAFVGGGLVAFAAGQLLQVFFVGGDQANDQREWSHMSAHARGRWKSRDDRGGRWTLRIFAVVTLVTLLYIDAYIWRPMTVLAWEGHPVWKWWGGALLAATIGLAVLAYLSFRGRASSVTSQAERRWVLKGQWPSFLAAICLLVLGVLFLMVGALAEDEPVIYAAMEVFAGFAFLFGAGLEAWKARRYWGAGAPQLEVVREKDRPLVLACTVTMSPPPKKPAGAYWFAIFSAQETTGSYSGKVWLQEDVTIDMNAAGNQGRFRFALAMPDPVPYDSSIFRLRVQHTGRGNDPLDFVLPNEAVFAEEYPAG